MKTYSYLYKKLMLTGVLMIFMLSDVKSQTSQGNWLVGGTGSFYFTEYKPENSTYDPSTTSITLSPVLGYFIKNNFVAGLKPSFSYSKYDGSGGASYSRSYSIGPLLRYYFLSPDKEFNLFAQGDFQYGSIHDWNDASRSSSPSRSYSFLAGSVIFLTSSIGVEFTAGYTDFKTVRYNQKSEKFQVGIGFQIHLKK